jgi:hypothetical protein
MFITLTSASPELMGIPMVLNTEYIMSIYRDEKKVAAGVAQLKKETTLVFCPPYGTWEIEETPEEILNIIAAGNK